VDESDPPESGDGEPTTMVGAGSPGEGVDEAFLILCDVTVAVLSGRSISFRRGEGRDNRPW